MVISTTVYSHRNDPGTYTGADLKVSRIVFDMCLEKFLCAFIGFERLDERLHVIIVGEMGIPPIRCVVPL